ncbi:hypothetical protein TKK_0006752 [Trichogramma kaykai]|uniref:Phospholipase A2 n=1 Tax=Trichogramma kaykai TaxID=54128 RepID=A0ABD2XDK0_9HYME
MRQRSLVWQWSLLLVWLCCGCSPSWQKPSLLDQWLTGVSADFKGVPELPTLDSAINEKRAVYFHEQLVAVIDYTDEKLKHCELIEVYEPWEAEETLKNLTSLGLKSNSLSFENMIRLMIKCDRLDGPIAVQGRSIGMVTQMWDKKRNAHPLLAGIVPGTKWCGTGDIAKNYHDLGTRPNLDRCCRMHDLCPVKIRAYKNRYNLDNQSFFSRSHCVCDETFYQCLKDVNHVSATVIGNVYFNVIMPTCIEKDPSSSEKNSMRYSSPKKVF